MRKLDVNFHEFLFVIKNSIDGNSRLIYGDLSISEAICLAFYLLPKMHILLIILRIFVLKSINFITKFKKNMEIMILFDNNSLSLPKISKLDIFASFREYAYCV